MSQVIREPVVNINTIEKAYPAPTSGIGQVLKSLLSLSLNSTWLSRLLPVKHLLKIIYNFTEDKSINLKISGDDPYGPPRSP